MTLYPALVSQPLISPSALVKYFYRVSSLIFITALFLGTGPLQAADLESPTSARLHTPLVGNQEADLAVQITNGVPFISPNDQIVYSIDVFNLADASVSAASLTTTLSESLDVAGANWTCTGQNGGVCTNLAGSGNIGQLITLPPGGVVTFEITADAIGSEGDVIHSEVSVQPPLGTTDINPGNNIASDRDTITAFADAFELQCPSNPATPPFLALSPSTIEQDQMLSVDWFSANADGCEVPPALAGDLPGWAGSKAAQGSEDVPVTQATDPGIYTLRLQCQNDCGQTSVVSRPVTVTPESAEQCGPDQQPPTSMTRAQVCNQTGSGSCGSYSEVFGEFPGTTAIRFFTLARNQYASLPFTPEQVPSSARLNINIEALQTGGIRAGQLIWSISNCPGDFNGDAVIDVMNDSACFKSGFLANTGFNFGGSSFLNDAFRCGLSLNPGTTYYLNIVYSNDDPATTPGSDLTWACGPDPELVCGHQLQPTSIFGWNPDP